MARVIILNPLDIRLPPFVIYLGPTCNRFTHADVLEQWERVEHLYNEFLLPVFKAPLVGRASDGDARRRKAMVSTGSSRDGERYAIARPANLWESKTVFCNPKNCIFPKKTVFYNKMRTAMQIKKKTSHTSELPTCHFQKKYY